MANKIYVLQKNKILNIKKKTLTLEYLSEGKNLLLIIWYQCQIKDTS